MKKIKLIDKETGLSAKFTILKEGDGDPINSKIYTVENARHKFTKEILKYLDMLSGNASFTTSEDNKSFVGYVYFENNPMDLYEEIRNRIEIED